MSASLPVTLKKYPLELPSPHTAQNRREANIEIFTNVYYSNNDVNFTTKLSARKRSKPRKKTPEKGQRKLSYYMPKPPELAPQIPQPSPTEEQIEDPGVNQFTEMEYKLKDLVRKHQLSEILTIFQMADQMQIQFNKDDMKYFYRMVQQEMINEFGAPLSPSLFPAIIFDQRNASSSQSSSLTPVKS